MANGLAQMLQMSDSAQSDPRQQLALRYGMQNMNQANANPLSIASSLANALLASRAAGKLGQVQEERRQGVQDTLAQAVSAANPQNTAQSPIVGPTQQSNAQRIASVLAQNPDTAQYGAQLAISDALKEPAEQYGQLIELPNGRYAQRNLRTGQWEIQGGSGVTVNTGATSNKVVEEANKQYGEGIGTRANERVNQGMQAATQNADLERIQLALDRGAQTGLGQETLLDLKKFGETFLGMELGEEASEQEVIRQIGNKLALRARNPDSGMGLPGATSNKDIEFLKSIVPDLTKSRGGLQRIIEINKRVNNYRRDLAEYQQRLIARNNGSVPPDLDTKLMEFTNDYEFFTPEERQELEQAAQSQPAQTQDSGVIDFSELQ